MHESRRTVNVTATEAKNRLGQVLEQAQTKPVFIEKAGRRHSVVLSIDEYDRLLAAAGLKAAAVTATQFYGQHREWFDLMNAHVEANGLWNDEMRVW